MAKKLLLIGLVCIGVTAFMASQASAGCCCNPRFCASWLKGDVRCDLSVENTVGVDDAFAECFVYGAEPDGGLKGTAFCAELPANGALEVLAENIVECRKKGKGHFKQKGKGHTKGKGKGHGDGCLTIPDTVIDTGGDPFVETADMDCNAECQASILIETRPDMDPCPGGYVLVDFIPDEFFGVATADGYGGFEAFDNGGYGGFFVENVERCTATGGLRYNCEPADFGDIPFPEM